MRWPSPSPRPALFDMAQVPGCKKEVSTSMSTTKKGDKPRLETAPHVRARILAEALREYRTMLGATGDIYGDHWDNTKHADRRENDRHERHLARLWISQALLTHVEKWMENVGTPSGTLFVDDLVLLVGANPRPMHHPVTGKWW